MEQDDTCGDNGPEGECGPRGPAGYAAGVGPRGPQGAPGVCVTSSAREFVRTQSESCKMTLPQGLYYLQASRGDILCSRAGAPPTPLRSPRALLLQVKGTSFALHTQPDCRLTVLQLA